MQPFVPLSRTALPAGNGDEMSYLNRCQRLADQLTAGVVTFAEYAYNVTLAMIPIADEHMDEAVGMISLDVLAPYLNFLTKTLEPVDFMPCPKPFIAGAASDEQIELAKRRLRPKYVEVYQLVKSKLAQVEAARSEHR
jgi:hypothetical protein